MDLRPYRSAGHRRCSSGVSPSPIPLDHFAIDVRARAVLALGAERRRLDRVVAELGANGLDMRTQEEDLGEIASASQHPADVASETFEREVELGLIDDFRAALGEVAAAELRVAAGTYGTCERCGGAVGEERLVAVPATRWCLPCAEAVERDARWRTPGRRRAGRRAGRRRVPRPRRPIRPRRRRRRVVRRGGGAHSALPAHGRLTSASVCTCYRVRHSISRARRAGLPSGGATSAGEAWPLRVVVRTAGPRRPADASLSGLVLGVIVGGTAGYVFLGMGRPTRWTRRSRWSVSGVSNRSAPRSSRSRSS